MSYLSKTPITRDHANEIILMAQASDHYSIECTCGPNYSLTVYQDHPKRADIKYPILNAYWRDPLEAGAPDGFRAYRLKWAMI